MNMPGSPVVLLLSETLGHLVMKTGISVNKYFFSSKRCYGNDLVQALIQKSHKICRKVRRWKQVH